MTSKAGRPKTHGVKSGKALFRAMFIQEAFIRHRQNGEKYEFAVEYAIQEWLTQFPKSTISITTVKRILAEVMSAEAENILIATKPAQNTNDEHGRTLVLTVGEGGRPEFLHPSIRAQK